jgi:hypothetical protein
VLVAVGWWPPNIPFELQDLQTVAKVLTEAHKKR